MAVKSNHKEIEPAPREKEVDNGLGGAPQHDVALELNAVMLRLSLRLRHQLRKFAIKGLFPAPGLRRVSTDVLFDINHVCFGFIGVGKAQGFS
jgi:hypothetical protein